jgi:predicted AAA+ superfamily ATPase
MFIGFSFQAFTKSSRKNLPSTPRFLFFDTGVRNAAAGLRPSPEVVMADPGPLFEQWVGLEIWKRMQYLRDGALYYMRSKDGMEIDYIIERGGRFTPVEVKWTEHPSSADARHLMKFLDEQGDRAGQGYIICRAKEPMKINERVTAIPWFCL